MANPELWRRVPSIPEVLVSTRGRFMIIPTVGEMPRGGLRHYSGRARRGQWIEKEKRYVLHYRGKNHKLARLVCEAFHGPAPFDRAVCMHLDEDSRNNKPTNLRWGTQKENLNAPGFLKYCRSRTGENSPVAKHRARAA